MNTDAVAELRARLEAVLRDVAEEVRPCKACETLIAFVRNRQGARVPYTLDGVNHFRNCPAASQFKTRRGPANPRQASMFDTTPRPP